MNPVENYITYHITLNRTRTPRNRPRPRMRLLLTTTRPLLVVTKRAARNQCTWRSFSSFMAQPRHFHFKKGTLFLLFTPCIISESFHMITSLVHYIRPEP